MLNTALFPTLSFLLFYILSFAFLVLMVFSSLLGTINTSYLSPTVSTTFSDSCAFSVRNILVIRFYSISYVVLLYFFLCFFLSCSYSFLPEALLLIHFYRFFFSLINIKQLLVDFYFNSFTFFTYSYLLYICKIQIMRYCFLLYSVPN